MSSFTFIHTIQPAMVMLQLLLLSLSLLIPPTMGVAPVVRGMKPFWNYQEHLYESRSKNQRWADSAWDFLRTMNCDNTSCTTTKECLRLVKLVKQDVSIHVAPTSNYGRYHVVLPEETLTRSEATDAVIVLDPYPASSFGHVVLVFMVDLDMSRSQCRKHNGMYLDQGECMYLALRRKCRNTMMRRTRRRNFARRCEINFLPVVHLDSDSNVVKDNKLQCQNSLRGYHACRQLRPANETSNLLCNPILENSRTCSTTHATIRTSCRIYEICDQAVILSGGWNRHISGTSSTDNVIGAYQLLRLNGFKRRNIKVFYANGVQDFKVPDESPITAHTSAMKQAIRYHLQRMCASPHCVDSLVLYLNSPTTHDGTMLLWDSNANGKAEYEEKYFVDELLEDLADCRAKRVQIFVDGSYSGEVAQAFKNSYRHRRTVVFASGKGHEYSYNNEFTKYWISHNDTRICTADAHAKSHGVIVGSTPVMSNTGDIQATLSGAACNVRPPYSNRELKRDFFGCQNLPTAVWLRRIQSNDGYYSNNFR